MEEAAGGLWVWCNRAVCRRLRAGEAMVMAAVFGRGRLWRLTTPAAMMLCSRAAGVRFGAAITGRLRRPSEAPRD